MSRRCVIIQSFGKQRVICNADKGGQTILPSEAQKLVVCTALKSPQHVLLALRGLPSQTSREQDLCCVVAWCEIGEEPAKAGGRGKRTLLKNQHNQAEDQDKDDEPPEQDEREDAAQSTRDGSQNLKRRKGHQKQRRIKTQIMAKNSRTKKRRKTTCLHPRGGWASTVHNYGVCFAVLQLAQKSTLCKAKTAEQLASTRNVIAWLHQHGISQCSRPAPHCGFELELGDDSL